MTDSPEDSEGLAAHFQNVALLLRSQIGFTEVQDSGEQGCVEEGQGELKYEVNKEIVTDGEFINTSQLDHRYKEH